MHFVLKKGEKDRFFFFLPLFTEASYSLILQVQQLMWLQNMFLG